MSVLLLDNFDSFTYNLYDYISELGYEVQVTRNDAFDMSKLELYSHIVISPGPGLPEDAGCTMQVIAEAKGRIPILGICLGMQAIGVHFGERLYNLEHVRHGIQMTCEQQAQGILFRQIPETFEVGLYHSWALDVSNESLKITALSVEGVVMAVESIQNKCFGVQFHPESIMTPSGKLMLRNFLKHSS
jgi:anthranilate synthase component II